MSDFGDFSSHDPKTVEDLAKYAQLVLQGVNEKFESTSEKVVTRIDGMGSQIDDLEKEIAGLMTQAGVDDKMKF